MSGFNGAPQLGALPFMPFGGGPGSVAGSDIGHGPFMNPPMGAPGFTNTASIYGMGAGVPRNSTMTNFNMFGGNVPAQGAPAQSGSFGGSMTAPMAPLGMQQRPMSTFSLATSVNPFANPSMNPDPTDDELFTALRNYLSTQDLMTVTKK